jgi:hypothetical protein
VVDAALRIVDRDGLDGVSMRRIAAAIARRRWRLPPVRKAALLDALVARSWASRVPHGGDVPLAERLRATVRSLRRR